MHLLLIPFMLRNWFALGVWFYSAFFMAGRNVRFTNKVADGISLLL